jgi:glycosyltransferase involved in cell wall biosynthesis
MPHRIAVVGPVHPYRGGIAHFTEMTVEALAARGHDVRPYSFSRQYPELLFPGKTQFAPDDDAPPEVRGASQVIDTVNPVTWVQTALRLHRARPDAVVFQYWMPFFAPAYGLVARVLRRLGIPSLAVVHNALPHERHVGDVWLSRFFLRACDGFVVMSDAVRERLDGMRRPDASVRQIEHPVYERFGEPVARADARQALGLPGEGPVALFFGFVREYKGLHVLLEAMPAILDAVPDLHLVVAGEPYEDADRYRQIIADRGIGDRVHWNEAYVPSDEVPLYFSAADLVVQPYVSATQSGVAQIAFHFETPMVVTDVGGLAEAVPHEEAGFVVPPRDPEALAAAVSRYVTDDWKERLTKGMRRQKERHAPERLAEAVEAMMRA